MSFYFQGVTLGITLAFLMGPALFVLLQTSLNRGLKAGLFIALGIFLSDVSVLTYVLQDFRRFLRRNSIKMCFSRF